MKTTLSYVLILLSLVSAQAQPKDGKIRERIRAQRVAFLTERLALTTEEAQRFWPVYNEFTDQLEAIKKQQKETRNLSKDKLSSMSDKEIEKTLNDELNSQQQMVDLQRKYQVELVKVIPIRKVAMLYKAERDFKLHLLKKMRESGQKPPPEEEF